MVHIQQARYASREPWPEFKVNNQFRNHPCMSGGHSPETVQARLGGGPGLKTQGDNTIYGGENQQRESGRS